MNRFIEELKNAWNKADNALIQLIYVNIAVFIFLAVFTLMSNLLGLSWLATLVYHQFSIPSSINDAILKPWTFLTYAFAHNLKDIWRIIINLMILYWFGKFVVDYLGNKKLISLYILGALGGAIVFLLTSNLNIVSLNSGSAIPEMIGSRAAVLAIVVAAATLVPNLELNLFLLGSVKIKYIAMVYVGFSFLSSFNLSPNSSIAHLGGAAMGYIYVTQLRKGNDLGAWIHGVGDFIKSFFVKPDPIKVSHRKSNARQSPVSKSKIQDAQVLPNQEEIDAILDKIAESGYESLSKSEKQKLFDASNK